MVRNRQFAIIARFTVWLSKLSDCSMAAPDIASLRLVIDLRERHTTLGTFGHWGNVAVLCSPSSSILRPDFDCHALCGMPGEFIKVKFATPGGSPTQPLRLHLLHLTSSMGNQPGFAPVDITLNGHALLQRHDVADMSFKEEHWDLPARMLHTEGEANMLVIQLCEDAFTQYFIKELKLMSMLASDES